MVSAICIVLDRSAIGITHSLGDPEAGEQFAFSGVSRFAGVAGSIQDL